MKTWRIVSIIVGALLLCGILVTVGILFWNTESTPVETQPTTISTTAPEETTTEQTTAPEETTLFEETTLPEATTLPEETSQPETTVPPTTAPPETTAPVETTVPPTTAPPETTAPPTTAPPETTAPPTTAPPETQPPVVTSDSSIYLNAHHAFVYDCSTGTYLYYKGNMDDALAPASMTKLFTAYVALQYMPLDAHLTAGDELYLLDSDSSLARIYRGQTVTVDMCIQGMLLPSGNDAAYILAVSTGRVLLGNPEADIQSALAAFVAEMNAQAQILGLSGSHFATPDGIDADDHYISPRDLCTIAQLVLDNPTIRHHASTAAATVYYVSGESINWKNSNFLLQPDNKYYCPDAIGLKTGYTGKAGDCLVSAFQSGDRLLIIGVYGCPRGGARYVDTLTLYDIFR